MVGKTTRFTTTFGFGHPLFSYEGINNSHNKTEKVFKIIDNNQPIRKRDIVKAAEYYNLTYEQVTNYIKNLKEQGS